jgi:hypothetical protein
MRSTLAVSFLLLIQGVEFVYFVPLAEKICRGAELEATRGISSCTFVVDDRLEFLQRKRVKTTSLVLAMLSSRVDKDKID